MPWSRKIEAALHHDILNAFTATAHFTLAPVSSIIFNTLVCTCGHDTATSEQHQPSPACELQHHGRVTLCFFCPRTWFSWHHKKAFEYQGDIGWPGAEGWIGGQVDRWTDQRHGRRKSAIPLGRGTFS